MKHFFPLTSLCLFACFLLSAGCDLAKPPGQNQDNPVPVVSETPSKESPADEEADKKEILECFNRYKKAVLNDNGEEALQCVDQKTLQYYGKILGLIKTATKEEVKKLSLLDKISVLLMRYKASKETILAMDSDGLFIYGVNNGMVSKDSTVGLQLGTITVEGDFAKSNIVSKGKEAPFGYHFYREKGKWKIDLTSVFTIAATAFNSVIAQQGMTEDEFIMTVLENAVGKEPDDSVWEPLQ